MDSAVDFVVNTYERTYRQVLEPGRLASLAAENGHAFERRTVVINNVADRADAERRAGRLAQAGELDEWFFVEDRIAEALATTGLGPSDLGRAPYFVDWGLVAVTLPGPDWIVHCDPEVRLLEPCDWIEPSMQLMRDEPRVIATNPRWYALTPAHDTLDRETLETVGGFALGLGFSDQLFLARRSELAAPIYTQRCVASRRYPMANVSLSFEGRVDAWMRHHERVRATYLGATYAHPDEIGEAYPARRSRERAEALANRALIAGLRHSPLRPHCCRVL